MPIRENIIRERLKLELSQDALAKKAKMNYNTLIKLESGANTNPTLKTLMKLAAALNITLNRLL